MITKFDSPYYGTADMENLGYTGTPINDRPRHYQLKRGWYPPAVGGAAVRCREVLGTPTGLPPSQERGAKKVDSTELR
jgi:hypothetical protein